EAAAADLAALVASVVELGDRRRDARDRTQDARELVQSLAAARLAGMAAELAVDLRDGVPCQVCGSPDHPDPASPAADAVTADDQRRAEAALVQCAAALETVEDALRDVRGRCALLEQASAGLSPVEAADAVRRLEESWTEARAAEQQRDRAERDLRARRDEGSALAADQAAAAATVATLEETLRTTGRRVEVLHDELSDALAEVGHLGLAGSAGAGVAVEAALGSVRGQSRLLTEAATATRAADDARERLAALAGQARDAAGDAGFADLAAVGAALVDEQERDLLRESLTRRTREAALADAVLEEATRTGVTLSGPEPDPVPLAAALAEAEALATEAERLAAVHDDRCTVLGAQVTTLRTALRSWSPARDEALRAESMSLLVRGMGHDNQLQMRLSAYVLATRLDQVVAAANERLAQMRDQRYLLQRTARVDRRGARAGLGLEVVDQWTGDVRAPTTLSGGETFVVSLSLALGLADVVTYEAGGTEIETLFVDEGFGTLDADTLDDVMDRLDGLRSGGRTVGVVSHVSELRSRIPTQVQVEKGRNGSTVAVRTLTG
ncbi:MAG: SMC family ATPase, partial [Nocardioidaceae bacterium]